MEWLDYLLERALGRFGVDDVFGGVVLLLPVIVVPALTFLAIELVLHYFMAKAKWFGGDGPMTMCFAATIAAIVLSAATIALGLTCYTDGIDGLTLPGLPWWIPRHSPTAKAAWDPQNDEIVFTRGHNPPDWEVSPGMLLVPSPLHVARRGVGTVWVGRAAVPEAVLQNWTFAALAQSEAAQLQVEVELNELEQEATAFASVRLGDVVSEEGVDLVAVAQQRNRSGVPYIAEDASLLARSPQLRDAARAASDAVLRTLLGVRAGAALPAHLATRHLWIGQRGSSSGMHFDPDPTNVLVQLAGVKDVWIFRPDHAAWLGRLDKWDSGAVVAASSGFDAWRVPAETLPTKRTGKARGGETPRRSGNGNGDGKARASGADERRGVGGSGSFREGDVCTQLNRVRAVGKGMQVTRSRSGLKRCRVAQGRGARASKSTNSDLGNWLGFARPSLAPPAPDEGAIHVRLYPGDALLIPQGWMHMARARTDVVSLSVRPLCPCELSAVVRQLFAVVLHELGLFARGNCTCHDAHL